MGDQSVDIGSWTAKENQYCVTWAEWLGGEERCKDIHRRGNEVRWEGGAISAVSEGNGAQL